MAANRLALKIISCFAVITCAVFVVAYSHFSIGALEQGNPNGSILMGFAVLWLLLMVWSSPFVFMPEQQQGKEKQKRVPPAIPYSRLFGLERGHYVYLIRDVDVTGYYKIGRTSNPAGRLHNFGVMLPFNIEVIAIIRCDDSYALETWLHRRFKSCRVNGEWFALADDEVDFIRGIAHTDGDTKP